MDEWDIGTVLVPWFFGPRCRCAVREGIKIMQAGARLLVENVSSLGSAHTGATSPRCLQGIDPPEDRPSFGPGSILLGTARPSESGRNIAKREFLVVALREEIKGLCSAGCGDRPRARK